MSFTTFKSLEIKDWKQFERIELAIHPKLTILTGANGSGKTTVLNLLSRHFGWKINELATPAKSDKTGGFRFFSRFLKKPSSLAPEASIGWIGYSNGEKATLSVPEVETAEFAIGIRQQQQVDGIYIPSHRRTFMYQALSSLSTQKKDRTTISNEARSTAMSWHSGAGSAPSSFIIKETLITWAVFGFGNPAIEPDEELRKLYEGFQSILQKILPKVIGFREFVIRKSEVVFITDSGDFLIDAVSGGVAALIDLAWQIYLRSPNSDTQFVILIDEIENHLHASMQREVLPNFLEAFENVQFIVSTHSPLIVGSVRDSSVYAFRFCENNRVCSEQLDLKEKGSAASAILRDVLGVPFTMPVWVEEEVMRIVDRYSKTGLTRDTLEGLRNELKSRGFGDLFPSIVVQLADNND